LHSAQEWRLFTFSSLVQPEGWLHWDVDFILFHLSADCSPESKIDTKGAMATSSGYYNNDAYWGPAKAFDNAKSIWLGFPDKKGNYWIGMNFASEFFQSNETVASELRLQAKPKGEIDWINILAAQNLKPDNNTF
jgi:hypothetical protein